jgi:hypothetical protein
MMSVMKDPAYRKYSAYVVLTPKSVKSPVKATQQ